jgi:predicted lipoprotein with Yx(FWY)xxD motif
MQKLKLGHYRQAISLEGQRQDNIAYLATPAWHKMAEKKFMRKSITVAIAASILSICVAAALAQIAPAKSADTAKGKALVDAKGLTLYTFDRDAAGKSNCNGVCATNWPPLMAGADAKASGDWTIVTRDDGGKQWAYKGKPLYEFAKDTKPGDVTGDGVNSVWHIAAP